MDNDVKEKIRQLAEPVVDSEGMELIHVECLKMHSRWIIRLFLDKEGGITLDDCANISSQLGDIFDIREVINGSYTLEVSSPGFDRPISRDQDFIKYKNSRVNIKTDEKIEGSKNFHGTLVDYIEEAGQKLILIDIAGKIYRIPKKDVVKANLADAG
jgi:ribosome maturation factor RimP